MSYEVFFGVHVPYLCSTWHNVVYRRLDMHVRSLYFNMHEFLHSFTQKNHRISHLYQSIRFDQNHKSHKFNRNWRDWSAVSYTIRIEWITISHKHTRNWRNWSGMWYHQTWLQPTYQGLFYETGETGVVYSITRLDYNKNTYNLVETGETEDMWYHLIWLRQKLKYIINWRNWSPTAYN